MGGRKESIKAEKASGKKRTRADPTDHTSQYENDYYNASGSEEVEQPTSVGGFGSVMTKILSRSIDKPAAVLAKRKTAKEKIVALEKSEKKKQREARLEKKSERQKFNVLSKPQDADFERQLRKVGTRGVIAFFNAVAKHQKVTTDAIESVDKTSQKVAIASHAQASFLDLLKQSTTAAATGKKLTTAETDAPVSNSLSLTSKYSAPAQTGARSTWLSDNYTRNRRNYEQELEVEDEGLGLLSDDNDY